MITLAQFDSFVDLVTTICKDEFTGIMMNVAGIKVNIIDQGLMKIVKTNNLTLVLNLFEYCQENEPNKLICVKYIHNQAPYEKDRNPYVIGLSGLKEVKDLFDKSINPLLYHPT